MKNILKYTWSVYVNNRKKDGSIQMNEENVKVKLVLPILKKLGWLSDEEYMKDVEFEYSEKGGGRVDCCLLKNGKSVLLIEIKAINESRDQTKDKKQVSDYCINMGVQYCVLTDGIYWKLYDVKFKEVAPLFVDKLPETVIDCYRDNDDDINNAFNKFLCIEKAVCMLDNDMYGLDGIWKDSFWELIKCCDADSCIDVLANRLKYEMLSKTENLNIEEQIFRKYAEKKIKENDFLQKTRTIKNFIDIHRKTFSNDFDKKSLDKIKEHVTSFVQKLGWQIEIGEGINDGILLVLKFENKPVSLILVKVFTRGKKKESDKNFLRYRCKKLGIQYCAVTNGIKWELYEFESSLKKEYSCSLFKELKLEEEKIEQVADFLSMFSKDIIENLPDMVASSRVLNDILNRNNELEREVLDAKEKYEKIEDLAKKLCNKLQEMKPDIKEDILVKYLKCYIRWYGTENAAKKEKKKQKKGTLSVKFPDGMVNNELSDVDIFCETLKRIGLDKIVRSEVINCKVPVVSRTNYPAYIYSTYRKSKIRNIDGYYILAQGSSNDLANLIRKIKSKLSELYPNDIEFLKQIEVEPK